MCSQSSAGTWGLNYNLMSTSNSSYMWQSYYRGPNAEGFRWVTGQWFNGVWKMYAITCPATSTSATLVYSFVPSYTTLGTWSLITTSAANTAYRGISLAPVDTVNLPVQPTPYPTFTPTATPTGSPSSGYTALPQTNAFASSSNILLVRAVMTNPGTATIGTAGSVFIDEVSGVTPYVTAQTLSVQSSVGGGAGAACTLSYGANTIWNFEQEGMPQLSSDGTVVTFPCYNTSSGSTLAYSNPKTIAVVTSSGTVDTTTSFTNVYTGSDTTHLQAVRGVATVNATYNWMFGNANNQNSIMYGTGFVSGPTFQLITYPVGTGACVHAWKQWNVPTRICMIYLLLSSIVFSLYSRRPVDPQPRHPLGHNIVRSHVGRGRLSCRREPPVSWHRVPEPCAPHRVVL